MSIGLDWFRTIAKFVEFGLRKFNEGKDRDCDSFMSGVGLSVLYKSCVSHLAKWTTLFAEFKSLE